MAKQLSMKQFSKLHKGKFTSKPCTMETQGGITRILTKWTWKDMRPISIVCDEGLKEPLYFLEPNYRIPSTPHISALICKDFEDGKILVKEQLKVNTIALTTDYMDFQSNTSIRYNHSTFN